MSSLVPDARLDEAAAALRSTEDRLATAARRLETRVADMRWRGYGADRFRRRATDRLGQLTSLRQQIAELSRELQRAAEDVRREASARAVLERASAR
jgi:uncharacterized protein YukE